MGRHDHQPAHVTRLSLKIVTTDDGLDKLQDQWDALVVGSEHPELMVSFAWLRAWWRHYGRGRTLCIGSLHDEDRLVGILPFCLRHFRYRFPLTFKRLELLGASEKEDDSVTSEFIGPIVARGYEEAVATAFVDAAFAGKFGSWDECVLEMMDGKSAAVQSILELLKQRQTGAEVLDLMQAPYVELPASWEIFTASLGKKRRQSIKYAMRDFETWAGDRGYELRRARDANTLRQGLDIVRRLHAERWQAFPNETPVARPRFRAFHDEVAPILFASGQANVLWLTVGEEPVAAHYHFRLGDRVYFYQSGRKMMVPKTVRLGIVMMAMAVRDAIDAGMREFDCLGGAAPYKSLFTHTSRSLVRIRVARNGWRETTRIRLVRLRDAARAAISSYNISAETAPKAVRATPPRPARPPPIIGG